MPFVLLIMHWCVMGADLAPRNCILSGFYCVVNFLVCVGYILRVIGMLIEINVVHIFLS